MILLNKDYALEKAENQYQLNIIDEQTKIKIVKFINSLPSAQLDMAENLYLYKCYITDKDGLQHEVIHTGDIRRVTGWEI